MTALKRVLADPRATLVVSRYAAGVVVAAESLFFARLLGTAHYGRYAVVVQLAAFLLFLGAGSASGYVYAYYRDRDLSLDAEYAAGAAVQYLLGGLLAGLALYLYEPYLSLCVLLFLSSVPYLITEPMLRVRNRFTEPVMGKAAASLATLIVAAVLAFGRDAHLELQSAIAAAIAGNAVGYGFYYRFLAARGYLTVRWPRPRIGHGRAYFRRVLGPGFLLSLPSVIFLLFTNIDRMFLEHYRPAAVLSVYSLAWQLSQGGLLVLTSLNMIAGIRVGERMGKAAGLRPLLSRQLLSTGTVALLVFAGLIAASAILEYWLYVDYRNLVLATALVATGYLCFHTVASVTSVLFYERRNLPLVAGNLTIVVLSVAANAAAVRWGLWWGFPVATSSLLLSILSGCLLFYTNGVVEQMACGEERAVLVGQS